LGCRVYFDDLPKESLVDVSEDLDWDVVELVENGPLGGCRRDR